MIDKLVKVRIAMNKGRSKEIVEYKFREYMREYDALANKSLKDKLVHRDLFYDYLRYMAKSEDGKQQ